MLFELFFAGLIHKKFYLDVTQIDHINLTVWLQVEQQACSNK